MVNKTLRFVFIIQRFYGETIQQKNGERTEAERARIELLSQQIIALIADNLWNAAVTHEDMVATGYLPTLAGR